jgi:DeoR/GlpR family transcriptional regulator of sugar metabolism
MLRDQGTVASSVLQAELRVTPMTIWRDLRFLEEQGLLKRVRGGARFLGDAVHEPDFETKAGCSADVKKQLAVYAVRHFVRAGNSVALEGGTTAAALVDALPTDRISVLTNSLPIALRLRTHRPALAVRIVGGLLSAVSGNAVGPDALREVEQQRCSVCFLSATGWDVRLGPMDPNPMEIEVKRALAAAAQRVVLLMESGKFRITASSIMIHPRRLHALVTNEPPPPAVLAQLESAGVTVLVASS